MLNMRNRSRALITTAAALALAASMAFGLIGCANEAEQPAETETVEEVVVQEEPAAEPASDTITFTDDLGRTVELPANITAICPSGFTAQ